ncbi:MAG TPA: HepT-like ribonuclease domain-containing protein [Allosphingosinicella sp.]|jgi:uncharacterized protein with HEPN domain|nr:HepT-like ribonuclease domain-containing protein [Allosphingosinicella sp.]
MHAPSKDADGLRIILQLIDHLHRRLAPLTFDQFENDVDEVDLTAFRLAHIGETAKWLSEDLRARHRQIPWRAMYDMRNVLTHDYAAILPERLWTTAREQLEALERICREELHRSSK